jgi:phosphoribosylanthranilate isomerase
MTKLKLCGMRTLEDLEVCREADYLGFVVLSDSPRNLEIAQAKDLMSVCDSLRVAVTSERRPEVLARAVRALEPDILQLHSPLDRGLLLRMADAGVPLWGMQTIRPGTEADRSSLPCLQALVLDSPGPRAGGNGTVHDWSLSRAVREAVVPLPVVLAGGLTAENVLQAIAAVGPYAVDISSGAEERDRKDPLKVDAIIEKVRGVIA